MTVWIWFNVYISCRAVNASDTDRILWNPGKRNGKSFPRGFERCWCMRGHALSWKALSYLKGLL